MTSTTCQETTKAGNPCKGTPLPGSDFCMAHQPKELDENVLCGHLNLHYQGEGDMSCDLPKGHEGNHSAEFDAIDYKEQGIVFKGKKRTYWSGMAGTPADQIEPDLSTLPVREKVPVD